jgi:short-subunit dehydrogenase
MHILQGFPAELQEQRLPGSQDPQNKEEQLSHGLPEICIIAPLPVKGVKLEKIVKPVPSKYGTTAFVAGAAEGIGASFARLLAKQGMDLVLADIRKDKLDRLAGSLEMEYSVSVKTVVLDLSEKTAPDQCLEWISSEGCRLLVYVPAYTKVRDFSSTPGKELDLFLDLNNRTLIHLVHGFVNLLRQQGQPGGIILMSSLAGLVGPPLVAPYAATKGFINLLSEALFNELKPHGIDVLACCAPTTDTPTYWKSNPDLSRIKPGIMDPEEVAKCTLRSLGRKSICIPGRKNRLQYFLLTRILSRKMASRIVAAAMRRMYPDAGSKINP